MLNYIFWFNNQNSNNYDRVYMAFLLKAISIDLITNCKLNIDLQLPTHNKGFISIKNMLDPKELVFVQDFVNKHKGKVGNYLDCQNLFKKEWGLKDGDVSIISN